MKIRTSFLPPLLAILASPLAIGQHSATTVPVGVVNYTLPATSQLTNNFLAVPLLPQPVFSGRVSAFDANFVEVTGTPFTDGDLSQPDSPFFLKITDGAQAGRMVLITGNTSNRLYVDTSDNSAQVTPLNSSSFSIAVGDPIQVVPGDTLASFFGDNTADNPIIIVGASSPLSADTVGIYNRTTSRHDIFYFSTSLGHWRTTSSTVNRNNTILFPESSFILTRRAGRPALTLSISGEVPSVSPLTKISGSNQVVYSSSRFPIPLALSELSLQNWTKSNSPLSADTLGVYNPTLSKFEVYFQRLDSTWRKVGDSSTDQSNFIINPESAVVFQKRGSVSGSTSYLSTPLPYPIN